jgi:hypothetical protein
MPAPQRRPHKPRQVDLGRRLVCLTTELEERPADPPRQRHALFQVPLCLLQPGGPELGDAETDMTTMDEPSRPVCYEIRLHNAHPVVCIVRSSRRWLVTGMAASEISDRTSHNESARLGSAGLEHITWRASAMSSSQVTLVAPPAAIIRLAVERRPVRRGWL